MEITLPNPTRRCSTTGKELRPGDPYHGTVVAHGDRLARHDYAPEAWSGPPNDAIGHWQGRVPATDAPRRIVFDDETLVQCFRQFDDTAAGDAARLRYVLALLLIRRKQMRLLETRSEDHGEVLVLAEPRSDTRIEVRDPKLSAAEMTAVQEQVFRLLGWQ
jgi:hypothetical protein